ncbi:hypothetical protein J2Y45_002126 [Dyadobacter sp. BE34]|uniref:Uncharacterized protein n=1 Tax=Dyadobacter fermentans TaxID=94254 RepID=A0ABU1QXW7_9BACT|nr:MULTISPECIES: hypothetical protein [Dyadobacter]MDR6805565.1 hypothetical protein [Dyadobacter fermentans]MDR7042675.1 hypothetical protein [Dyadobacter sp. BE242]MDR7196987.1 hypothetical protein [Dyadobacter sp. BE34]MDR7215578.1 hypothetical protein [Dyadobacter sp. BE31]MDR7263114.1 hypothetical protein [Dyadobacter sp. BE32]
MAKTRKPVEGAELETKRVRIVKLHPLVVNEPGETPTLPKTVADKLLEMEYAEEIEE